MKKGLGNHVLGTKLFSHDDTKNKPPHVLVKRYFLLTFFSMIPIGLLLKYTNYLPKNTISLTFFLFAS